MFKHVVYGSLLLLLPQYKFPMVAVTSKHQLGCLKQQKFILLQFRMPDIQNQYHWAEIKMSAGPYSSRGSQGKSVPGLLKLLLVASVPWLVVTSL